MQNPQVLMVAISNQTQTLIRTPKHIDICLRNSNQSKKKLTLCNDKIVNMQATCVFTILHIRNIGASSQIQPIWNFPLLHNAYLDKITTLI